MSLLSLLFLCRYWPVLEVEAPSQRGDEQDWIPFEASLRACNSVVWGSSFTWVHSLWNPSKAGGESKILISEKNSYLLTLVVSFGEDGSLSLWWKSWVPARAARSTRTTRGQHWGPSGGRETRSALYAVPARAHGTEFSVPCPSDFWLHACLGNSLQWEEREAGC